jgi:hypothetical protein
VASVDFVLPSMYTVASGHLDFILPFPSMTFAAVCGCFKLTRLEVLVLGSNEPLSGQL